MVLGIGTGLKFNKLVYFWYRFRTGIHRFLPSNTGVVPIPTCTEPCHTRYIRYRCPLLWISVPVFAVPVGNELIKSCSNAAMQVANGIGYRYRSQIYQIGVFLYRFRTGIHRFLPSNTGAVPIPTCTEPCHTRYIRYRYPLLGISVPVFSVPVGNELIKSCSNAAMQVIAPFRLLFIHTVSKLYFV
ncbi:hypothetical protein HanIR_Chr10g0459841 [Helianthus annuus]|nr:hypothetical protein HanIR_Chr10g0459841 [Helianthus annuus]